MENGYKIIQDLKIYDFKTYGHIKDKIDCVFKTVPINACLHYSYVVLVVINAVE